MFKCDKCNVEFQTEKQFKDHTCKDHKRSANEKRKERIPVGIRRKKLDSRVPPDKVPRWVNDDPGRLQRFLDGGYEFISDPKASDNSTDLGSKISMVVDKGTGKRAYLMAIDKDLYQEDQDMKNKRLDRVDHAIKHGKFENKLGKAGYDAGIKYDPK